MAQTYDINIKLNVDDSELQNVSSNLQELEADAENATTSTDALGDSVNNVQSSGLEDAADGADDLAGSASEADTEIQGLGTDLDLINAGALLAISEEIGNLGQKAESMSQDMNQAAISVGQLATQTGIAEPQMVNLINHISNATFPHEEAVQYVQVLDQLGVSSSKLGDSATDMDRINDAFGIGSNQVVSLTGNLYAMGVPADNLSSSFNALGYAQGNVAGGVQQFSNTLQRLAPLFGEYNFNVDQAAVITGAATSKWGTGRKAMSNLSTALKDANGDTHALEEALGLQAGSLDNATQLTGQYEGELQKLANEEADHKTLVDQLGAAWEDVSLSLQPILSPLGSVLGMLGDVGQATIGVMGLRSLAESLGFISAAETVEAGALAAEGVAATGAGGAFGFLGAMELTALWPILAIIGAVALLVVGFEQLGEWLGWWDSFGGMIDSVKNNVMRLWDAFVNSKTVQAGIQFVKSLFDWLWSVISPIFDAISSAWDYIFGGTGGSNPDAIGAIIDAFSTLDTVISTVINNIQAAIGFIMGLFLPIISGIQMITTTIGAMFTGQIGILDGLMIIGQTIMNMYMAFWGQIGALFMQGLQALWGVLSAGLTRLWNSFLSFLAKLAGLPGRVGTYLMGVVGRVTSWAGSMAGKAASTATNFVSRFTSGITSLPSKVASGLGQVLSAVERWGGQMISKAGKIAGDFVNKIKSLPGNILNGAELNLGLNYGFNGGTTSNYGFDTGSSLNTSLARSSSNSNTSTVNNNFNINGLIEETASEYIVKAVNDNIRKQNLIRGV